MRGTLYGAADEAEPGRLGYEAIPWPRLAEMTPRSTAIACAPASAAGRRSSRFDIDFVDPAFAPGTGTPEVGGPTSAQALSYVRALTGIDFRAFDCVEVAPAYDPAGITSWLAARPATRCSRCSPFAAAMAEIRFDHCVIAV